MRIGVRVYPPGRPPHKLFIIYSLSSSVALPFCSSMNSYFSFRARVQSCEQARRQAGVGSLSVPRFSRATLPVRERGDVEVVALERFPPRPAPRSSFDEAVAGGGRRGSWSPPRSGPVLVGAGAPASPVEAVRREAWSPSRSKPLQVGAGAPSLSAKAVLAPLAGGEAVVAVHPWRGLAPVLFASLG